MMKRKVWIPFIAFVACSVVSFYGKDDPITGISKVLATLNNSYPQENVHLHLDKPYYALTDTVWFKAYVTLGESHELSGLSKIIYVDLISPRDSIVKSLKFPVMAGTANGFLAISDTLLQGDYRIRAYTRWMRNEGQRLFFEQTISIGDGLNTPVLVNDSVWVENNKVNAKLRYTNLEGKGYAAADVNYDIQSGGRSLTKGSGKTDESGYLLLNFANDSRLSAGKMITRLHTSDKKVVSRVLPFALGAAQADVQFLPESGKMVEGIFSKLAIKALGRNGMGIDVKGRVVDNLGQEVAVFESRHLGMGLLAFKPEHGKTYTAEITYPDGSANKVSLPPAAENGLILSVNTADEEQVQARILVSPVLVAEVNKKEITVLAIAAGKIAYATKFKTESPVVTANIPKARLPEGITQLLLLSETGEPLNERLVYVHQPVSALSVKLATDRVEYSNRSPVQATVKATNAAGQPVTGTFSVAVTDESIVAANEDNESSILSDILLKPELKGYIEQPGYYFSRPWPEIRANLDLLLLTQGFRKWVWKDLLAGKFPEYSLLPETGFAISGTITNKAGKPAPNSAVRLFGTGKGIFMADTVADATGKFNFTGLDLAAGMHYVIRGRDEKGGNDVNVTVNQLADPEVAPGGLVTGFKNLTTVPAMSNYLKNNKEQVDDLSKLGLFKRTIRLDAIALTKAAVSEKKEEIKAAVENSDNRNGPGRANHVLTAKDFEHSGCTSLYQCLIGRVPGVKFMGGLAYLTRVVSLTSTPPVSIYLDGLLQDPDALSYLSVNDVEAVEIMTTGMYTNLYDGGAAGIILVTSKRGGEGGDNIKQFTPDIITYSPKAFSEQKEFYSPKYNTPAAKATTDRRSTIFWDPNVFTSTDGIATFKYYNADGKGSYRMVIEGIDLAGNVVRNVYRYKVL